MPVYEYKCDACGHDLEVMQKMTEEPKKMCPQCHKRKLRRVLGAPAVIFKGTGWTPKSHSQGGDGYE